MCPVSFWANCSLSKGKVVMKELMRVGEGLWLGEEHRASSSWALPAAEVLGAGWALSGVGATASSASLLTRLLPRLRKQLLTIYAGTAVVNLSLSKVAS